MVEQVKILQRKPRCRIFVSYAHDDIDGLKSTLGSSSLPAAFMEYLRNLLSPLQDKGYEISADSIFFDGEHLNKEPSWRPAIYRALAECELFILLVSAKSIRRPGFCMDVELAEAAKRQVPVIPVVLTATNWANQPVPGRPKGEVLGQYHSGGLPKAENNNLLPVSKWIKNGTEDEAWLNVINKIDEFICSNLPKKASAEGAPKISEKSAAYAMPSASKILSAGSIPYDLLPYYCNQEKIDEYFKTALDDWAPGAGDDGKALVILVKGIYHDDVEKFYRRLQRQHLQNKFRDTGLIFADKVDLHWPASSPASLVSSLADEMISLAWEYDLIPRPESPVKPVEVLKAGFNVASALHWHVRLPRGTRSAKDVGEGLRAWLEFLECCPAQVLGKQVFIFFVEDPEQVHCEDLCKEWQLNEFKRAHLIELPRLLPTELNHALEWFRTYRVDEKIDKNEIEFRKHLVDSHKKWAPSPWLAWLRWLVRRQPEPRFRLREFALTVAPLLASRPQN